MAFLSFQPLHNLRLSRQRLCWSANGDLNLVQSITLTSSAGRRRYSGGCIRSQILSAERPKAGVVEKIQGLKAGDDDGDTAQNGRARSPSRGRINNSGSSPEIDQKQWGKMMNEIRSSGDAVTVLARQRKAKKLSKETMLGTLVRLKQLRAFQSVIQICEWLMEQDWWQFGFEDHCLLMTAYGKQGEVEKAETLLERFSASGYKPNIAMHTGLIEAYARKRMFDKVEGALRSLLESGPAPTVTTYHTVLKAYTEDGRVEDAERIFSRMCKGEVKPDGRIYNLLIHGYGKAGRVDRAFELYQEMRNLQLNISVVTFNTLLACQKNIRDAESIFRQKLGDLVSFGGLPLKIYCSWFVSLLDNVDCRDRVLKSGKLRSGSEGLMEALEGCFSVYCSSVIRLKTAKAPSCNVSPWKMKAANVRADVISYTTLMNAYAKSNRTEKAQELFDKMVAYGVRPTQATYNVLLDAYARADQVGEAEIVMKKMRKDKCTPSIRAFTTLLHAYALVGKMEKAEEILRRMKSENVTPNEFTYSAIMAGYAAAEDMDKMTKKFNEMKALGLKPNQAVYTVMIGAWGLQEDFEAAKFWFKEMVSSGCELDARSRSSLVSASKTPQQLQEALALVESCE